jgi:hypothetical protein
MNVTTVMLFTFWKNTIIRIKIMDIWVVAIMVLWQTLIKRKGLKEEDEFAGRGGVCRKRKGLKEEEGFEGRG